MSGYEYEDETQGVTWSIVNDIKQVTEDIISALIGEIEEECIRRENFVSHELATFTLKLVYQDPKNGFEEDQPLDKDSIENLTKLCVDTILEDHGPLMETVRMQLQYEENYASHAELILEHYRALEARLGPLTREISESRARTRTEMEDLYSQLVMLVVIRSGLGDPTSAKVLREAATAMQSVFPQSELLRFMKQTRFDKKAQIRQLALLVAGIRIFNWDSKRTACGGNLKVMKAGAGIEDLPTILSNAVEASLKNIDSLVQATADKIHRLTSLMEKLLYTEAGSKLASEKDTEAIKYGLVNVRQFQVYVDALRQELKNVMHRLSTLDQELLQRITDIQVTLLEGGQQKLQRLAVPASQVFPQFIKLAETWRGFQEETIILSRLDSLRRLLYDYTRCLAKLPYKRLAKKMGMEDEANGEQPAVSDAERNQVNSRGSIIYEDFVADVVSPGDVQNYDHIPLEYAGFCPVALVSGQGFVIPGNNKLGYLFYKDRYYSTSTVTRAEQFGRNPDLFIVAIKKLIRDSPCLLKLLNVTDEEIEEEESPRKTDRSSQTEAHEETRAFDPNYHWNEWDLRRQALRLAELRNKRTHSSQTYTTFSDKIQEDESQIVSSSRRPKSDEGTQTTATRGVGTSNALIGSKSYIIGLRGETAFPVEHIVLNDLITNARGTTYA